MKEITTTYEITIDGKKYRHTDTYNAQDVRDAHMMIIYHWSGVEKITFINDVVVDETPVELKIENMAMVDCTGDFEEGGSMI